MLNAAIEKTSKTIREKNPALSEEEQQKIAHQVGVGAVIYSTLSASRIKDISFSLDRVLNFDGETGPYVQYTHVRACSVLRRYEQTDVTPDFTALSGREAFETVKTIAAFGEALETACEKNEPSVITRWVTQLAQQFNKFYYECKILDDDQAATAARVMLTRAVRDCIKTGLYLLGIEAPEKM